MPAGSFTAISSAESLGVVVKFVKLMVIVDSPPGTKLFAELLLTEYNFGVNNSAPSI